MIFEQAKQYQFLNISSFQGLNMSNEKSEKKNWKQDKNLDVHESLYSKMKIDRVKVMDSRNTNKILKENSSK